MNKLISAVLAMLFLLCSCSSQGEPEVKPNENDLSAKYHIVIPDIVESGEDPTARLLYKINSESGSYMPLCNDPVCKHDSDDCIAYNVGEDMKQHGDYLFFVKVTGKRYDGDTENAVRNLYRMDLKTGEYEVLLSKKNGTDAFFPSEYIVGDTALFATMRVREGEPEPGSELDRVKYHTDLYRFDFDTKTATRLGRTEDLNEDPETDIRLISLDTDTVTWGIGRDTYVTDFDLNVIETSRLETKEGPRVTKCGEYEYIFEPNANEGELAGFYDMYISDSESGEKKLIAEDIRQFPLMLEEQNTILFMKYHSDPDIVFPKDATEMQQKKSGDSLNYTKNNVYAMDLDGSNSRLLCHVEDPYLEHIRLSSFFNNISGTERCVNDTVLLELTHGYIGYARDPDDLDEDGWPISDEAHYITAPQSEWLGGFALVNVKTGDCKVVYPFGDPTTYCDQSIYAVGSITDELKQK